MDTLRTYLDGLFMAVPTTAKTKRAKADLYDQMVDRYHEELARGKQPDVAVAAVISQFGDLDELLAALDEPEDTRPTMSPEQAQGYWAGVERFAQWLSLGIAVLIGGIGLVVLATNVSDIAAALSFFVITAAGVALIIAASLGFRDVRRSLLGLRPDEEVHALAEAQLVAYRTPRTIGLVSGILMIALSFVPVIIAYGLNANDQTAAAMLFFFIAFGVYFIVYTSIVHGGFKQIAAMRVQRTQPVVKRPVADGTQWHTQHRSVSDFYWPVATLLFLALAFGVGEWGWAVGVLIAASVLEKPLRRRMK